MFSAKDRMSYRYFHKRAHYLAVIFASLQLQSQISSSPMYGMILSWEYASGDERRPTFTLSAGRGSF